MALAAANPARAQGCAMCYNTASAASAAAIQALRSGILVLTFPPIVIFVAIFVLVLRRRNRFGEEPFDEFAAGEKLFRAPDSLEPESLEDESAPAADWRVSNFEFREAAAGAELAGSPVRSWK